MKDPDSSNDVKKEENAEDMSLADLLGGGDESSSDEPKRVDHRADEPDSGMVNLAKMVASSSVEVARTPSMMPPPMEAAAPGTTQDPSGSVQTQRGIPVPAQPGKKSQGPLFAIIAVAIVAILAIGYFATRNGDDDDIEAERKANQDAIMAQMMADAKAAIEAERKANQDAMAQMMAKLAEMDKDKGSTDEATAEEMEEKMAALKAELEAAKKKDEDLAAKEEEAASKAKTKTDKPKKTTTKPKKKVDSDDPPASVPKKKKTEKAPPEEKKSGTSELDSLLNGSKKEKEQPKTAPASDLPKQPTKVDVKKAMGPVQARAQKSCAKYSTGTVQVQVIVSGKNGRVTSATPKGAFAGNQAGKCVAMMSRSAKFPKFADSKFSFTYPITLQ